MLTPLRVCLLILCLLTFSVPGPSKYLNFNYFQDNAQRIKANLTDRHPKADVSVVAEVTELLSALRAKEKIARDLRQQRNNLATLGRQDKELSIQQGKTLKAEIKQVESEIEVLEQKLNEEGIKIPNDIHPDVPRNGQFTTVCLKGEKPDFGSYTPLPHWELGKKWDLFDFERGAEVSEGRGFYYSKNAAALLEMALISWITLHMTNKHGFTPIITPDLVHVGLAEACGFRPRSDASQMYNIKDSDMCLIGTSEISLGALHSNSLTYHRDWARYPIQNVGFSHCFRAETSHGGALSRGLFRVHQFSKVEMFIVCLPEQSEALHQKIVDIQMDIFSQLGLHYRFVTTAFTSDLDSVLDMPSDDLGFSAYRKYDIEAWFPSRNDYGEISSCSNCTDYQGRRLNIRTKNENEETVYLHTLNGTAMAVPRIIMAILENFQLPDKRIRLPDVLVPFMGGATHIGTESSDSLK